MCHIYVNYIGLLTPNILRHLIFLVFSPLEESIGIYGDYFFRGLLKPPSFPENVFVDLMDTATMCDSFSFSNIIYRQDDGVSIGSRLELPMAKMFVGF